jgi:hypothetical protein
MGSRFDSLRQKKNPRSLKGELYYSAIVFNDALRHMRDNKRKPNESDQRTTDRKHVSS